MWDSARHPWEPLLPLKMREEASDLVRAIAADVLFHNPPQLMWDGPGSWEGRFSRPEVARHASLANGSTGFSLLFGYLADADLFEGAAELSTAYLNTSLAAAEAVPLPLSLYSGVAGIGWALARSPSMVPLQDDRGLASVTDVIATAVRSDRSADTHFDLITGVVGCGVFGLETFYVGDDTALIQAVAEWLMSRMAERAVGSWFTSPQLSAWGEDRRAGLPQGKRQLGGEAGYFDLGVAHGVPGVLAVLDDIVAAGPHPAPLPSIIDAGVQWLFSQRLLQTRTQSFHGASDGM